MDSAEIKKCLTLPGFMHKQRDQLSDRDLYFVYCGWLITTFLHDTVGKSWHDTYCVALCIEGNPIVSFLDNPVLNLRRFFTVGVDQSDRLSIKRITDEDHCAHGMHVAAGPEPDKYAFDVVVWVRSALEHLETFFNVRREKIPGKVAQLQFKCGFLPEKYNYNLTCSCAMIVGMAIDAHEKLANDRCNSCGKSRESVSSGKLSMCQRCCAVRYCGKTCQVSDWKAGHADECSLYKSWAKDGVKLRGRYITIDPTVSRASTAVDSMLERLQITDPKRLKDVTILV